MSQLTRRSATGAILAVLVVVGVLVGIRQASAQKEEAVPQLNDEVLTTPPSTAVVAADFYNVSRVKACAAGGGSCDFGLISAFCDSGDELVGAWAWRQFDADGAPATVLPSKFLGNNPVRGMLASMTFVPAAQRAILRIVCANTNP